MGVSLPVETGVGQQRPEGYHFLVHMQFKQYRIT
jgi:hypothetical protein